MISNARLLDYVVEILKASDSKMSAREICNELQIKGIAIEKTELNRILWSENSRPELVVDQQTFKWHYDRIAGRQAELAAKSKENIRTKVAAQPGFAKLWDSVGFEFLGVRRRGTDKPLFFFLREEGNAFVVIGPAGKLLREKADNYSSPDAVPPSEFTLPQVKNARSRGQV